jgi:hypothetical protein
MCKLYYPNGDGTDSYVGQFSSVSDCYARMALDNQANCTINVYSGADIIMVVSC